MSPFPEDARSAEWFADNLTLHSTLVYSKELQQAVVRFPPRLLNSGDLAAAAGAGPSVLVLADVALGQAKWQRGIPLGPAELCLRGPVRRPAPDWIACPNIGPPLWWRSPSGALLIAWDVWGTVRDLLRFEEERATAARDKHGRFAIESSQRWAEGVAAEPVVNHAFALIAAACRSLRVGRGSEEERVDWSPKETRVRMMMSHDCDILGGNDPWTQSVRIFRVLAPGRRSVAQRRAAAAALWAEVRRPGSRHLEDLRWMWARERERGINSTSYILNGPRGLRGARSPFAFSMKVIAENPPGGEIGVHYNIGALAGDGLSEQIREIERYLDGARVLRGRAHYLRFNPLSDFDVLERHALQIDESVGWPYHRAYRVGLAGAFLPWDERRRTVRSLIEVPVNFMDNALVGDEPDRQPTLRTQVERLRAVGGIVSLLFHPGFGDNPEHAEYLGLFEDAVALMDHADCVSGQELLSAAHLNGGPSFE
jgi:hypothetical protein